MDASDRRRTWTGRVLRDAAAERRADIEFWKRLTPNERLALVWDLTLEAEALRTGHAEVPRLQRSVTRVLRA
jgi:hypothetical protein